MTLDRRTELIRINRAFARDLAADQADQPNGRWFPDAAEIRAELLARQRRELAAYQAEYRETRRQEREALDLVKSAAAESPRPAPSSPPRQPVKPSTRPPAAPSRPRR